MRLLRRAILGLAVFSAVGAIAMISFRDRSPVIDLPKRPIAEIRAEQRPILTSALAEAGLEFGSDLYLRLFKEEAELEVWVRNGETYDLFKTYPICRYSGGLGPKLREGDRQAPEGFYQVRQDSLNPWSSYHLSFNLGFPNAFDRAHGRTGSFLMVHGACVSIGCYAMTDPAIEEIYVMVEAALRAGQDHVPVHAFPFRMTERRLAKAEGHRWHGFWSEIAEAYQAFETKKKVPQVEMTGRHYQIAGG
ncbi:L,D-transpeptidase family protein [Actibacterium pelagium]|uniref:L,D-TPase catalytic domain-containing protein n=1 Tax=Actibacterium pelagium TaxID=2029103 RepID=A0A917EHQ9_9RHOB|nr:murein L,D-transpeptidase family protein [Actibacterium pelagium]GGE41817.1 hypothetical protein GCM10011517_06790 [Actibacterium pelagium]